MGLKPIHALSADDRATERLILGLRLVEGLALDEDIRAVLDDDIRHALILDGHLDARRDRLKILANSRLLTDALIERLVR